MGIPKPSLKTLVFAGVIAALALGWWADHHRSAKRIDDLQRAFALRENGVAALQPDQAGRDSEDGSEIKGAPVTARAASQPIADQRAEHATLPNLRNARLFNDGPGAGVYVDDHGIIRDANGRPIGLWGVDRQGVGVQVPLRR